MSIETAGDLNGMKRAGHVTRLTLDALEAHVRVGVTTAELDAVAATIFSKYGARSSPTLMYRSPESVQDSDGWAIRTRDGSLAAHHEHTLVITRGEPVLLTAA